MTSFGPVNVTLVSSVALIRMQDHEGSNRICVALEQGLLEAMDYAVRQESVRVLVLEGLPDVFCAGGTAEDLAGYTGRQSIDKWPFVRAPAECPLPVVAAVQGHAVGGGLLLALYADVILFSDRSSYAANFMSYGFTPCLGATYLLPAKLGNVLGTEMLLTGRPFRGKELAQRQNSVPVVPHDEVSPRSHGIARRIAHAPRRSLEILKKELADPARSLAEDALERELPGHLETFASTEVRQAVERLYPGQPSSVGGSV